MAASQEKPEQQPLLPPSDPPEEEASSSRAEQQHETQPGMNPPHVQEAVDQDLLRQLKEDMGFDTIPAEKALYHTKNESLEAAIAWLTDHQDDLDINVPLGHPATQMSKEEAMSQAVALQQRLREARQLREKQDAIEKERRRIELGKNMLDTQRMLEEAGRKRAAEEASRDKRFHEEEKARQLELLKQEWEERFGRPYPVEQATAEPEVTQRKPKDQVMLHAPPQ